MDLYEIMRDNHPDIDDDRKDFKLNALVKRFFDEIEIVLLLTNKIRKSDLIQYIYNQLSNDDETNTKALNNFKNHINEKLTNKKTIGLLSRDDTQLVNEDELYEIMYSNIDGPKKTLEEFKSSNFSTLKEIVKLCSIVVDEEAFLKAESYTEKFYTGFILDNDGYDMDEISYLQSLDSRLKDRSRKRANSIYFWKTDTINNTKFHNVSDQFLLEKQSNITKNSDNNFEYLRKWLYYKIPTNKDNNEFIANNPKQINSIVGILFNRLDSIIKLEDEGGKKENLKLSVIFHHLIFRCLAPVWIIENILPRIYLSITNTIENIVDKEYEILERLAPLYIYSRSDNIKNNQRNSDIEIELKNIGNKYNKLFYNSIKKEYDLLESGMKFQLTALSNEKVYNINNSCDELDVCGEPIGTGPAPVNSSHSKISFMGLVGLYLIERQKKCLKEKYPDENDIGNNIILSAERDSLEIDKSSLGDTGEAFQQLLRYTRQKNEMMYLRTKEQPGKFIIDDEGDKFMIFSYKHIGFNINEPEKTDFDEFFYSTAIYDKLLDIINNEIYELLPDTYENEEGEVKLLFSIKNFNKNIDYHYKVKTAFYNWQDNGLRYISNVDRIYIFVKAKYNMDIVKSRDITVDLEYKAIPNKTYLHHFFNTPQPRGRNPINIINVKGMFSQNIDSLQIKLIKNEFAQEWFDVAFSDPEFW